MSIILKYSSILFIAFVFQLWLFDYSGLTIPEYISHTPIKISGILLGSVILMVLILVEKAILKIDPSTRLSKLTLLGASVGFISEVPYQIIRSFSFNTDRFYRIISGIIITLLFMTSLSFFIAFQLKTKKTSQLILFIIAFIIAWNFLIRVFPLY